MPDFIRPNYHVILIHYPLALLGLGLLIELFSLLFSRRSTLRAAGRWMILFGAVLAAPAVTSGMYAMWDVASHREGGTWADTLQKGYVSDAQWQLLRTHTIYNIIGVGLSLLGVVAWLASSDRLRRNLYLLYLLLLLGGYGFFVTSSWYAGEMVYAHGLSVEPSASSPLAQTAASDASALASAMPTSAPSLPLVADSSASAPSALPAASPATAPVSADSTASSALVSASATAPSAMTAASATSSSALTATSALAGNAGSAMTAAASSAGNDATAASSSAETSAANALSGAGAAVTGVAKSAAAGGSIHPSFADTSDGDDVTSQQKTVDTYVNPLQLHLIFAGLMVSISLVALGLTIRGMTRAPDLIVQETTAMPTTPIESPTGESLTPAGAPVEPLPGETAGQHAERSALAGTPAVADGGAVTTSIATPVYHRVPSARFWLLAAFIAILTAAGGLYTSDNLLSWDRFRENIVHQGDGARCVAHVIVAGSIIILGLIMAILAKAAPRSKMILSIFLFFTLLVIAAQFWLGTLLLFDGGQGSLVNFRMADATGSPTLGQAVKGAIKQGESGLTTDLHKAENALHLPGGQTAAPAMPTAPAIPAAPTTGQ